MNMRILVVNPFGDTEFYGEENLARIARAAQADMETNQTESRLSGMPVWESPDRMRT